MIGLRENTLFKGKVYFEDNTCARFSLPDTSVKVNFKGTRIAAVMESTGEDYFEVVIDGKVFDNNLNINRRKLYMLADGLADTEHSVEIYKRTKSLEEITNFYGFELFEGELLEINDEEKLKN